MIILIVIAAWIVLALFGWSLLRASAQADRNTSVQPMRPWAEDLDLPAEDARPDAAGGLASAHSSHAQGTSDTPMRARA